MNALSRLTLGAAALGVLFCIDANAQATYEFQVNSTLSDFTWSGSCSDGNINPAPGNGCRTLWRRGSPADPLRMPWSQSSRGAYCGPPVAGFGPP